MSDSVLLFGGFGAFVLVVLTLDLVVFHRRAHSVRIREAAFTYVFWVSLAVLFNIGVFIWMGADRGNEFLTAYVIELSLSVDNIFVFVIVFSAFGVPPEYRHRVLFMGILGAVVMRGVFIATGVALLERFVWLIFIFGGFLVFTGIKLAIRKSGEVRPEQNPVMRVARRFLPVTQKFHGQKFFVRESGRRVVTPLFMVLLGLETTDLIFAIDSVPAVLAISDDTFIIWTSNVFAILGLRALFFLVDGILPYFRYLNFGLSVILVFIGIKMITSEVYHMPTAVSLGVVGGVLSVTILASYIAKRREDAARAKSAAGRRPGDASPESSAPGGIGG